MLRSVEGSIEESSYSVCIISLVFEDIEDITKAKEIVSLNTSSCHDSFGKPILR